MKKKGFNKITAWIMVVCMLVTMRAPLAVQASEPDNVMTGVGIEIVTSGEGTAFYQENQDRYIIGPKGWIEYHITVQEEIASIADGSIPNPAVYRDRYLLLDRMEGEKTLVFRFTPTVYTESGYITLDRIFSTFRGAIRFMKKDSEGNMKEHYASGIDLNRVGGLSRACYRNQFPKVITINPDPAITFINDISQGINIDKLVVSVNEDPMLSSSDFEIQYTLSGSGIKEAIQWTACGDMNYIPIPEGMRKGGMHLFLEVRDRAGNYYPYSYDFYERNTTGTCRVYLDSGKIIAGGDFFYEYTEIKMPELCNSLRNQFKNLEAQHETPRTAYEHSLGVFLYINKTTHGGYSNTIADIDFENCGYQWSKDPGGPEPGKPFIPFEWYQEASDYRSRGNALVQGYWAEVRNLGYDIKEDGTYYLYIRMVDAVTGGVEWQLADYNDANVNQNDIPWRPVKFIKDVTPPDIHISEPQFTSSDYEIDIEATDNYGLSEVQYHVCDKKFCWEGARDINCNEVWVDIPIGQEGKKAAITLNTSEIYPHEYNADFKVHVRAVESKFSHSDNPVYYKSMQFYIPREPNFPVLNMGYFGEIDSEGKMAPAGEHKIYLYGHPGNDFNAPGDIYYRIDTVSGDPYNTEWMLLDGNEVVLSGKTGEYIFRAYVEDAWNKAKSQELVYNFYLDSQMGGASRQSMFKLFSGGQDKGASVTGKVYEEVYGEWEDPLPLFTLSAGQEPVITAALSTNGMTNNSVAVTLSSKNGSGDSMPVKITVEDGDVYSSGDEYAGSHMFTAPDRGHYIVNYETQDGFSGKKDLYIGNIDRDFTGSRYGRAGMILYTPAAPTKGNVKAWLFVGEKMRPDGDGYTYQNGWVSYTFENNGTHTFDVTDLAGNKIGDFTDINQDGLGAWNITAKVDWIDKDLPDCTITYSKTGPTNQPVDATIHCPPGVTVYNNGGQNTHTFYDNGSFSFTVKDAKGLLHSFQTDVTNIDKEPPAIELTGQLVYPLYQGLAFDFKEPGFTARDNFDGDLTTRVRVENNVDVYEGGYYEVVYTVTDTAGNTAREVRSVPVYKLSNVQLIVNNARIKGNVQLNKGELNFQVIGQQSGEYTLKYLPGKYKPGEFKGNGTEIAENKLIINEEGWYTFYVTDAEMTMFCGQAYVK